MMLPKVSSIGLVSLLFLATAACSVQLGEASPTNDLPSGQADAGTGTQADPDAAAKRDANAEVVEVSVVGTSVTSAFHADGSMAMTLLPKNAARETVLSDDLTVHVNVAYPSDVSVEVVRTECTAPAANITSSAIGVVLDDSLSMVDNDPQMQRKSAAVTFLKALGKDDSAMLTDYGNSGLHLRDLVCAKDTGASCSPATPSFTRDKAELVAAAARIAEGPDGTPLYESCVEMVSIVDTVRDQRRGMLLLSDGQPTSMSQREACHQAARTANIPVFTVGLGPAAEASPTADPAAVKVLRELASETGGSYASANDPAQLDQLFANVGTALARGSCRTTLRVKSATAILPGVSVTGEVTVGSKGAKASFTFVTPAR